jgi:hypothetical protein
LTVEEGRFIFLFLGPNINPKKNAGTAKKV